MISISKVRKLLPEETKELVDQQIQFMLSRIGDVPEEEFADAWAKEYNDHLKEMATFLYDMYQQQKQPNLTS